MARAGNRPRSSPRRRRRLRAAVAFAGALVVAQAAVLLLEPRSGLIEPAAVDPAQYFTPEQIARARDFRTPQLALGLGGLAVQLGVLAWLARRPPRWLPRAPLLAGAAVSLALTAAGLPLRAVSRARALDVGLATQSWGGWLVDVAKRAAISAAIAAVAAALLMWLMRRLPRTWWLAGAAAIVGLGAGLVFAGPVVLDPLFNRFQPLPAGPARADVLALARRAGIDVGEVYVMDASRRTSGANAYVTGLGRTKRIVLYDTLVDRFPPAEMRLVVAHELGHVANRDVPNGLLYLALVAPAGMLAVARMRPRSVPALWLAIFVVATPIGWISNQLSRRVEARADAFALRLTDEPRAFIAFERRITLRNVSDPDPPRLVHRLFGTHPTTVQRIGIARAYAAGAR